jgi:asparagine synthase (glutamine-hydrolysing)
MDPEQPGAGAILATPPAVAASRRLVFRLLGESVPFASSDAGTSACSVIFDGVIHNRAELSGLLGLPDAAKDDADLILHAYLRWGIDMLRRMKGMFALVVWDGRTQVLLCARDRTGIYPLYYASTSLGPLFSTSIDALLAHPRVPRELNSVALAERLGHRWSSVEETYFAGVRRVPAGHVLRMSGNDQKASRYWEPHPPGSEAERSAEHFIEEFEQTFDCAVDRCLEFGPAGILLSGGLDSVSVAAVAAGNSRARGLPVPWALSLAFPSPECNEEPVQRAVLASGFRKSCFLSTQQWAGRV